MTEKLDPSGTMTIPAMQLPTFRASLAQSHGVANRILMRTWGGIGDQVCAEPTLREVLRRFRDHKGVGVYLASELPELFAHLDFNGVFNLREAAPVWSKYLVIDTIREQDPEKDLAVHFFSHLMMNGVDYASVCALKAQLPVAARRVVLEPGMIDFKAARDVLGLRGEVQSTRPIWPFVAIHPGRHWQSKTFPAAWWDAVIAGVAAGRAVPVVIGADADDNRGTVDIDKVALADVGGIDARNQLGIMETVALLDMVAVLLTNDSSPLHLAAPSDCWIGFVATCKHPDMISHWRKGGWAWRMQNHGLGGVWSQYEDDSIARKAKVDVTDVGEKLLLSWLPDPRAFAQWSIDKINEGAGP